MIQIQNGSKVAIDHKLYLELINIDHYEDKIDPENTLFLILSGISSTLCSKQIKQRITNPITRNKNSQNDSKLLGFFEKCEDIKKQIFFLFFDELASLRQVHHSFRETIDLDPTLSFRVFAGVQIRNTIIAMDQLSITHIWDRLRFAEHLAQMTFVQVSARDFSEANKSIQKIKELIEKFTAGLKAQPDTIDSMSQMIYIRGIILVWRQIKLIVDPVSAYRQMEEIEWHQLAEKIQNIPMTRTLIEKEEIDPFKYDKELTMTTLATILYLRWQTKQNTKEIQKLFEKTIKWIRRIRFKLTEFRWGDEEPRRGEEPRRAKIFILLMNVLADIIKINPGRHERSYVETTKKEICEAIEFSKLKKDLNPELSSELEAALNF